MRHFRIVSIPIIYLLACGLLSGCGITGNIPDQTQNTATAPLPQPNGSISCKEFGCKGDGKSDDTSALRSAVQFICNRGGGSLFLPEGSYKIFIQDRDEVAALRIGCSNFTLQGAGRSYTTISVYTLHGADPDTACPLNSNGDVNRGAGLYLGGISGTSNSEIHVQGVRLTGNRLKFANRDGGTPTTASKENCFNSGDVSNRGIIFGWELPRKNISVIDSEVDHFAGELIDAVDSLAEGQKVVNNILHHSNANGMSISGELLAQGNLIYEIGSNAIENNTDQGGQTIISNRIYTVANGITLAQIAHVDNPPYWNVSNNTVIDAKLFGIMVGAENSHVHDNSVTDSAWSPRCCYAAIALVTNVSGYPGSLVQNVEVDNNTVSSTQKDTPVGIEAMMGDELSGSHISIHGNSFKESNSTKILNPIIINGGIEDLILY